jgi:hypothetical protein
MKEFGALHFVLHGLCKAKWLHCAIIIAPYDMTEHQAASPYIPYFPREIGDTTFVPGLPSNVQRSASKYGYKVNKAFSCRSAATLNQGIGCYVTRIG